jgi:hypothetical protein
MRKIIALLSLLAAISLIWQLSASAQTHQGVGQGVTQQVYVSHADATISASASPAALATPAAATKVVYQLCQNTGATNNARVGDANVGVARGTVLPPCTSTSGCAPVPIPFNGGLYAYSAAGTTVHCDEIDIQ